MKFLLHCAILSIALCATVAESAGSGRVALTRLSLGEIGGWIELSIKANNKTGRWLLDTGSSRNLVSLDFASRHGLKGRSSVTAVTALGQLQGAEVSLPTLRVGSLERAGQTALMVDLRSVVGAIAEGLDGILGASFFAGFGLTLVQRNGSLYVEMVLPGGPAQAAGLREGEAIKRWVGGPPAGSLQELWSRVQGLDQIELAVGDEARPMRLRRAYFAPQLP